MGLQNQVALVTGAVSSTGYAYTKYLLQNGVKVALCDTNFEKCQSIVSEFDIMFGVIGRTLALRCNVTDQGQFENAFKSCIDYFGRLDIVVNNASVFDNSTGSWDDIMNIHYGGVVRGTILAMTHMGAPYGGKGGTVVQTASEAADSTPDSSMIPVCRSSKRSIIEYTRAVGDERSLTYLNIRIMALCPSCNSENVGRALIHILERGKTGECWVVENDEIPRLAVLLAE